MYGPVQDVTCHIRNVVYAIICPKCRSDVYVGETEWELQNGMTGHLREIRLKKDKPINFDFGEQGHTQNDMAFAVVEKMYGVERKERLLREGIWIKKLSTVRPGGSNVKGSYIPTVMQ